MSCWPVAGFARIQPVQLSLNSRESSYGEAAIEITHKLGAVCHDKREVVSNTFLSPVVAKSRQEYAEAGKCSDDSQPCIFLPSILLPSSRLRKVLLSAAGGKPVLVRPLPASASIGLSS